MKRRFLILSMMALALILLRGTCQPDLIISEFTVGTITADTTEGYYVAPATVKVKNIGNSACGSQFWVETLIVSDPDYHPLLYFTVPGKFEKSEKWQCKALDVHEEETWTGTIYIKGAKVGSVHPGIRVDADKEIDEGDETNNEYMIPKLLPPWP